MLSNGVGQRGECKVVDCGVLNITAPACPTKNDVLWALAVFNNSASELRFQVATHKVKGQDCWHSPTGVSAYLDRNETLASFVAAGLIAPRPESKGVQPTLKYDAKTKLWSSLDTYSVTTPNEVPQNGLPPGKSVRLTVGIANCTVTGGFGSRGKCDLDE